MNILTFTEDEDMRRARAGEYLPQAFLDRAGGMFTRGVIASTDLGKKSPAWAKLRPQAFWVTIGPLKKLFKGTTAKSALIGTQLFTSRSGSIPPHPWTNFDKEWELEPHLRKKLSSFSNMIHSTNTGIARSLI